jgi:hypothetical protein
MDGVPPCPAITIRSAAFSPEHPELEPSATEPINPQKDISTFAAELDVRLSLREPQ